MKGRAERLNQDQGDEELAPGNLQGEVNALFRVLSGIYGAENLVLKAGKVQALRLMRSQDAKEHLLALERIVLADPTLMAGQLPGGIGARLERVKEGIAELIARQRVENELEEKAARRAEREHLEYLREIKLSLLKEEKGPESSQTLKKYAQLEKLELRKLGTSTQALFRPRTFSEVVGQAEAIKALLAKVATPYPQHVILYGPPGVGKTSAARLVLEYARQLSYTPFAADAPFVEADGSTLRWDPREATNPLLGSVHDPIYQGARRELSEAAIPEPKLGLVTEAHGGILFIDEIGEMDLLLQTKLLKVLEDKRVRFESSYYDPSDPRIPKYIKKLFDEGAPADFILIGATTRRPSELDPALRSRCAEVFFAPLGPTDISAVVRQGARRLKARLGPGVPKLISQYVVDARRALGILTEAYGRALARGESPEHGPVSIKLVDVRSVLRSARLSPYAGAEVSSTPRVGRVLGLGVSGFLGSVLEVEALALPAALAGRGELRFNNAAGNMTRDSLFNATTVLRQLTNVDLKKYDLHVNVVGGGQVEGPSAGAAIFLSMWSAVSDTPLRQDVAVSGEISLQGRLKPVGGIPEKIYGARQAGVKRVVLPQDNHGDIPADVSGVEVVLAATVEELIAALM
ncbi:MAG: ATP-dependent protease, Lon family [Firmicutes bacterium]|jgi:ATP-dependent Lon protease|nr:ATP-dependent protease, Lon family [Bacillota bacterium]